MPSASASASVDAPAQQLWELVRDPHHLPRWWPRVQRVEAVDPDAFTEVLLSDRGRIVRADFLVVERDEQALQLRFAQQIAGTPFQRILAASETAVQLRPHGERSGAPTLVTVTLEQTLPGVLRRGGETTAVGPRRGAYGLFSQLGSPLVRRAALRTVKEALDGLQRIAG
ncbi:MAG: SRPBCC family protein [Solirubrobacteraceae bacterium]